MAIRVKLPNGEIGEFPDDMPHEEIESVLQKQFPPEHQSEIPSTGIEAPVEKPNRGIAADTAEMFSHALKSAKEFIGKIPTEIKGISNEFQKNPLKEVGHAAGQMGVGLAESAKGLANLGLSALTPISEIGGIPKGGHPFEYQIPENTGLQKALGLESNKKGDTLLKAIPDILAGTKGAYSLGKVAKKLVEKPSKELLFKQALEDKISAAEKEHNLSKGDLDELKKSLRLEYSKTHKQRVGELSPEGQQETIDIKQGKLEQLKPSTEITEQKIGEMPSEPDTKAIINQKKEALERLNEIGMRLWRDCLFEKVAPSRIEDFADKRRRRRGGHADCINRFAITRHALPS